MKENLLPRIEKVEQRLDRIEKKLKKQVEERKMDLKEKFRLHDYARNRLRQFETRQSHLQLVLGQDYKDIKEIVENLVKLVDVALGVKFPS